jgi:hypothetical protein
MKVAGGRDYRVTKPPGASASHPSSSSSSSSSSGEGAAAAAQGAAAGCFWGPDGNKQLLQRWREEVDRSSGGRECETVVPLKFGRQLWVPRALVVDNQQQQQQQQRQQQQQQQQQPQHQLTAALFTFDQLCGPRGLRRGVDDGGPLSAVDCLALVDSGCRAVYVEGVHQLTPALRDEARRLVTLVDLLYDRGTKCEYCV